MKLSGRKNPRTLGRYEPLNAEHLMREAAEIAAAERKRLRENRESTGA